jgi:hypothetical protein
MTKVIAGITTSIDGYVAGPGDGPGKGLGEGGERLQTASACSEGFTESLDLEHLGVRQSQFATFIDYRLK